MAFKDDLIKAVTWGFGLRIGWGFAVFVERQVGKLRWLAGVMLFGALAQCTVPKLVQESAKVSQQHEQQKKHQVQQVQKQARSGGGSEQGR